MTEPKTISELMIHVMEESKKGNINNAIFYLNEAIEIEPHDPRFYISRGAFKEKEKQENEDAYSEIRLQMHNHLI